MFTVNKYNEKLSLYFFLEEENTKNYNHYFITNGLTDLGYGSWIIIKTDDSQSITIKDSNNNIKKFYGYVHQDEECFEEINENNEDQ